jgi:alkaline phosphatase D
MFAPQEPAGRPTPNADSWDGYRPARNRVLDFLRERKMPNAVVLTGDVHSSWAYDIAADPWSDYNPDTGRGTQAIEVITTSVTSPGRGNSDKAAERYRDLTARLPHLKYAEGASRGYVVLDVTASAVQADWFFVPAVEQRTTQETFAKGFVSAVDNPHLVEAASPARPAGTAPEPAR